MLLFVDLLKPYVLFVGGVKFGTPSIKMSKQIFFPPKDLMFQWPCPLFAHSKYGLVLPCCLVVEGQVHHIRQIMFSPMDMPLNTSQLQFMHCHHIDSPNRKAFYLCNME